MANDAFTTTTETADPTADLVGEGKKFKDVAALARGKVESDAFIEQLKREAAGLREELAKKVDSDKVLQELRAEVQQLQENKTKAQSTQATPETVSADTLKALIATSITEHEKGRTEVANVTASNNAIIKHFGSLEKAQQTVQAKAAELGLSIAELKATAAKSPTAFLKLLGVEGTKTVQTERDVSSTVNTTTLTTSNGSPQEGTKEYYDALLKSNPKLYWTPKIQNAIFKAAQSGTYDHWTGVDRG